MRNIVIYIILSILCSQICIAQKVLIGSLYYEFHGANVYVTYKQYGQSSVYTNDSYIIPSSVKYNEIEYNVSGIGDYAFSFGKYSSSITASLASSITLPSTIKSIGKEAFRNCPYLSYLNLGTNLETIDDLAFFSCISLTSLVIPASVMSFGDNCFSYCNRLSKIIYLPKIAPTNWTATSKTYVPDLVSYSSPSQSINDAHVIEMITFDQTEFDYSGQAPTTLWTNNVEGYTASLSLSDISGDVGSHEEWIPVTFTKGEETFTANVVYRYTIKPVKLTAKVEDASREYGEDNPQFSISYSGFVNGEDESVLAEKPSVSTIATNTSNVGEYSITISGGSSTNYEFVYEPGVLTVTKAPLSAKVNDATKVYGAQNPSFTIEYYGLKNGETVPTWKTAPTLQTEATKASNVGQYDVKAIGGIPRNYEMGEITKGTLSVTPASLTIKANDATRQYYSDEPNFSYTCTGLVNGDDKTSLSPAPTLSTTATRTSNVGTYEIKVADAANPNYSISYTYGTLTITPRTLVASVGNYERLYNEDNPAFEVKYDGFVEGEDEGVLTSKATARTSALKTSDVGTYPINVSGGSADNYTFNYTSGTLSINKAEQTIAWEQDLSELEVGDQIELKGVASSGLPITYTMDNGNAAEIYTIGSKSYLDCKAGGQFIIRAVQSGNKNYYSSPRVTNKVTIVGKNPDSDPMLTIQQADNGSIGVRVSKGCIYTFSIAPSAGWKIHSVTFNNTNVTNQLSNEGEYTTPAITSNSTLSVVYEEESGSNIKSAKMSNVKVQATSSGIKVIDADMDEMIWVYTTDGKLQYSTKVDSQQVGITLDKNNVYIVKVGSKTFKVGL